MAKKDKKYCYWVDESVFSRLNDDLALADISMYETKRAVCVPMSSKIKIGIVAPTAWDKYDLCRRQLSWYKFSPYYGMFLIISSFPLTEYGLENPHTVIELTKFKIPEKPNNEQKKALVSRKSYQILRPDEWENIDPEDKEGLQVKWMKVMGVTGITYPELFAFHCANHANFIEPRFFVNSENGDGIIPYSIEKTKHACSCCLEFFNIIGSEFKTKLVVPCPGAALFAGMSVNKYYQVTTEKV